MKKLSKTARQNGITYGIVIIAFVVMQILISTGNISSSLEGLLIPFCYYVILACLGQGGLRLALSLGP